MSNVSRRDVLRSGLALSATSILAASPAARAEALLRAYPGVPSAEALAAVAPRERLLMDFDWKFFQGHACDPSKDLGYGSRLDEFGRAGNFYFARKEMDDSKWTSINLPHDWAVSLPFVHDDSRKDNGYKPLGRKYPETSVGWYHRTFDIPATDLGRRIHIDFDGAVRSALFFLNGYFIGRNDNAYAPFSFDVTDYLKYGEKNYMMVRMEASYGDGWFYEGAGIYRHVWLTKTDAVHLGQWETYVRSDVKGATATLSLGTLVKNDSRMPAGAQVHWKILDDTGKTLATAESPAQTIGADRDAAFTASATLKSPSLWSPETPVLYKAIATVTVAGKPVDAEQVQFGVRTLRFDADKGFFLNGKSTKIKGTCNHQDHAGVGAAMPDRLQWYRLAILKDMGSNAVRTSHNMPTPEWVEACDRMGMMMLCETRLEGATAEALQQYTLMVKRYRNSPAVIAWSIGNEEWNLQAGVIGERVATTVVAHSHELDPTRMCTAAVNGDYGNGISKALDIEGFNYNLGQIDPYHKTHPTQPLLGTETASTIAERGIYLTDKPRNWISAYDVNVPRWAETAEQWWKFYAERDFLPGGFVWTGFDYRGEPTPYAWPSINSFFGIIDMCGFPKDDYFYYKSWWGTEPVLHLLPHWNWEQRTGEPISVWVHSNLDEVELFLNGTSHGKQAVKPLTHLEWSVKFQPGTLEARGSKGGKVVMTEKRETTGPIASLRLVPDRTTIDADGEDLVCVRVEGVDAQGRLVPVADDFLQFKITGAGRLLGVGNGDPNCLEADKEPKRSLFNGLAMVIVQSTRTPGDITIEAFNDEWPGPKLPNASVTVTARKVTPRASI